MHRAYDYYNSHEPKHRTLMTKQERIAELEKELQICNEKIEEFEQMQCYFDVQRAYIHSKKEIEAELSKLKKEVRTK